MDSQTETKGTANSSCSRTSSFSKSSRGSENRGSSSSIRVNLSAISLFFLMVSDASSILGLLSAERLAGLLKNGFAAAQNLSFAACEPFLPVM